MIKDKKFQQKGGDQSLNIQGDNITINQNLSYEDVRQISYDIFEHNFIRLRNDAKLIVEHRIKDFTEKLMQHLNTRNMDSLHEFSTPGMQDSLFNAQKEYAKSGDNDLADLLIDIIIDRANQHKRNILQIVLDESISIVSKLTIEHIDSLSLIFILTQTEANRVKNYFDFLKYFQESVFPFAENFIGEQKDYLYLEFLRCGTLRGGTFGFLQNRLEALYRGCFSKGFTTEELKTHFEGPIFFNDLIGPYQFDQDKFQLNVRNISSLRNYLVRRKTNDVEIQHKLIDFFRRTTMDEFEIENYLKRKGPTMTKIFILFNNNIVNHFQLSSVGTAIAIANYRRKTGKSITLSNYIS